MCAEGSRDTVAASMVLPSVDMVGAAAAGSEVPTTFVVSVVWASTRTIRAASLAGTTLVSKPSSDTASVGPAVGGVKTNVPSGPVETVAITTSPLRS